MATPEERIIALEKEVTALKEIIQQADRYNKMTDYDAGEGVISFNDFLSHLVFWTEGKNYHGLVEE